MVDYIQVLSVIVAVLLVLYYYFTLPFDYWKHRGVPGPQPIPGFGNTLDVTLAKKSLGFYVTELYNVYKNEPLFGIFEKRTPTLVVRDLDLVKDVLIKDFSVFNDRGKPVLEKVDPLSLNLVSLETERWRPLRARLSPVFTTGKIKEMFPLILECSEQLEKYLEKLVEKEEFVECRDMAAKFTTDTIGSCAFGIDMKALSNEESQFRRMGKSVFEPTMFRLARVSLRDCMPWVFYVLSYLLPISKVTILFTKIISETMKYRKENNIVRPDFVNMLMELKDQPEKLQNIELTDNLLTAQAFTFFVAGFETSSTTIGHTLYEMALNTEIQDKLRKEIRDYSAKNNGDFKFEVVKEMKFLDKVFKETLRKYPPGMLLKRRTNKNYTFNGTKVTIAKNAMVFIPAYAIQHDPSVYPNPEIYDPERFNEDAVAARHPMSFLPFGDGPRNCIGARFAIYQTKIGLIKMLQNFRFDVCEKTIIPYVHDPISFVLSPKGGIYLKISKVEN